MRVLVLTRWFSIDPNDGTMVNDMAVEMVKQGHTVTVLCVEWKGQEKTGEYEVNGIPVWWYSQNTPHWLPKMLQTPYKMLTCSQRARRRFADQLEVFKPEAIIAFSFAFSYAGLLTWVKRRFNPQMLLVLWDFFPYHHFHIRGIKNPVLMRLAAMLENSKLQLFDFIGLMTPRNLQNFRKAYMRVDRPKLKVIPVCGPPPEPKIENKLPLREMFNLPKDKVIAVFGGALSPGRGIHEILDLARVSSKIVPSAFFVIVGDGPLWSEIEAEITEHGQSNILLLKRLERNDYQKFISACDIGIVSTVSDLPMIAPFPSKTIDYFRNHLAVLASVEEATDYAEILENEIKGGLASRSGDIETFTANLKLMVEDAQLRGTMAENGVSYFGRELTVSKVSEQMLKLFDHD